MSENNDIHNTKMFYLQCNVYLLIDVGSLWCVLTAEQILTSIVIIPTGDHLHHGCLNITSNLWNQIIFYPECAKYVDRKFPTGQRSLSWVLAYIFMKAVGFEKKKGHEALNYSPE